MRCGRDLSVGGERGGRGKQSLMAPEPVMQLSNFMMNAFVMYVMSFTSLQYKELAFFVLYICSKQSWMVTFQNAPAQDVQ